MSCSQHTGGLLPPQLPSAPGRKADDFQAGGWSSGSLRAVHPRHLDKPWFRQLVCGSSSEFRKHTEISSRTPTAAVANGSSGASPKFSRLPTQYSLQAGSEHRLNIALGPRGDFTSILFTHKQTETGMEGEKGETGMEGEKGEWKKECRHFRRLMHGRWESCGPCVFLCQQGLL